MFSISRGKSQISKLARVYRRVILQTLGGHGKRKSEERSGDLGNTLQKGILEFSWGGRRSEVIATAKCSHRKHIRNFVLCKRLVAQYKPFSFLLNRAEALRCHLKFSKSIACGFLHFHLSFVLRAVPITSTLNVYKVFEIYQRKHKIYEAFLVSSNVSIDIKIKILLSTFSLTLVRSESNSPFYFYYKINVLLVSLKLQLQFRNNFFCVFRSSHLFILITILFILNNLSSFYSPCFFKHFYHFYLK